MKIDELYIKYIADKVWTYSEYISDKELDKARITAGFDIVYREGKNCPFTIHEAIIEDDTADVLVSGRCYTKHKWQARLARGLRVSIVNFYPMDHLHDTMEAWHGRCQKYNS